MIEVPAAARTKTCLTCHRPVDRMVPSCPRCAGVAFVRPFDDGERALLEQQSGVPPDGDRRLGWIEVRRPG